MTLQSKLVSELMDIIKTRIQATGIYSMDTSDSIDLSDEDTTDSEDKELEMFFKYTLDIPDEDKEGTANRPEQEAVGGGDISIETETLERMLEEAVEAEEREEQTKRLQQVHREMNSSPKVQQPCIILDSDDEEESCHEVQTVQCSPPPLSLIAGRLQQLLMQPQVTTKHKALLITGVANSSSDLRNGCHIFPTCPAHVSSEEQYRIQESADNCNGNPCARQPVLSRQLVSSHRAVLLVIVS